MLGGTNSNAVDDDDCILNTMFVAILFELFHYFSAEINEMTLLLSKYDRSGIILKSSLWMKEEWRY